MGKKSIYAVAAALSLFSAQASAQTPDLSLPEGLRFEGPSMPVPVGAGVAFRAGVNYPWNNYGWDFGANAWGHHGVSDPENRAQVAADFSKFKSLGVRTVRWFLLGDGRAAPEFDAQGLVTGLDEYFFPDMDAALEIAQQNDIQLVIVLMDFELFGHPKALNGVTMGGHPAIANDPKVRQSFYDKALLPILDRYGAHPAILAWEVANEPEIKLGLAGSDSIRRRMVKTPVMQSLVTEVVSFIHSHTKHFATLGSHNRTLLPLWRKAGLDFYQFHYYGYMALTAPLNIRYEKLGLDKPCVLGEFPTKFTTRSIDSYLDVMLGNGFAGAWAWSYKATDRFSDFAAQADKFADWVKKH
ncbi:MAG: hypothetical protein WC881_06110 [Elusimicrobiota bacterium]|jgi:hypothetical protein